MAAQVQLPQGRRFGASISTDHRLYMNQGIRDYSQWFRGSDNNVADSLSRDFHLSDPDLTLLLLENFPSQVPENFRIVPLHNKIACWATSVLRTLPVNPQFREVHTPTKLGRGPDGPPTAPQLVWPTTPTSPTSIDNTKAISSAPSAMPYTKGDMHKALQLPWLLQQSAIPSITWLRPSIEKATRTQRATTTDN